MQHITFDRNTSNDGFWTLESLIVEAVKKELGVKKVSLGAFYGKHWEGRSLEFGKAKADGVKLLVCVDLDLYAFDVDCWTPEYDISIHLID